MLDATDAIISIHPKYADAILAGRKTIELRRRVPELPPGTRLWIYATRPTGAVIGVATIQEVDKAHPTAIWKKHRRHAGVDYDSFKAYFEGTQQAVAISLAAVQHVGPITIGQLREIRDSFHPPQVLIRLTAGEAKALRRLAADPAAIASPRRFGAKLVGVAGTSPATTHTRAALSETG